MTTIFSNAEINTGRQTAVDLAKFFSIFFMVIIHTMECAETDVDNGTGYFFDSVAGAQLGAPVFMAAMGIGLTFSRHSDAITMLRRGLKLFIAGYLLNIIRAVPVLAMVWLKGDEAYYLETIRELTDVDIFQFAGLTFMLLGLLKYLKLNMWWAYGLALVMTLLGNFIRLVDTGHFWLNVVISPFVGVSSQLVSSDFPLLNWFVFVVIAYGLGKLIRRCTDLDKFYLIVTPVPVVIYLSYIVYAIPQAQGMFGDLPQDFYHMKTLDVMICLCAILMALGLSQFVATLLSEKAIRGVTRVSGDITKIYIASWILAKWGVGGLLTNWLGLQLTPWMVIIGGTFILLLSALWARVKPLSLLKI